MTVFGFVVLFAGFAVETGFTVFAGLVLLLVVFGFVLLDVEVAGFVVLDELLPLFVLLFVVEDPLFDEAEPVPFCFGARAFIFSSSSGVI